MEKFDKAKLSVDEKFNSLLDECRTAIKQAFKGVAVANHNLAQTIKVIFENSITKEDINNVRIINTARFTIIKNGGNIIVIDPLEDVKQNLDEIRSADKLMDIITEISYIKQ